MIGNDRPRQTIWDSPKYTNVATTLKMKRTRRLGRTEGKLFHSVRFSENNAVARTISKTHRLPSFDFKTMSKEGNRHRFGIVSISVGLFSSGCHSQSCQKSRRNLVETHGCRAVCISTRPENNFPGGQAEMQPTRVFCLDCAYVPGNSTGTGHSYWASSV